jgi:hypothetical protein
VSAPFRYEALPVFHAFERVSDPTVYTPLPDDWHVGVADVVKSTDALRAGRYKAVNMAGASVVGAVRNALGSLSFPFVFGGDGAVLAVPADAADAARAAMAATTNFVAAELDLVLRVGMLSVAAIRAGGNDMKVARYAASPQATYAMFSGGGANFAEAELKAGRIGIDPTPREARPDLTGLSCRWSPIRSQHGMILSILVLPAPRAAPEAFRAVATKVIEMTELGDRGGHPVRAEGPQFAFRPAAMRMEAAATRHSSESLPARFARIAGEMALGIFLDRTGRSLGGFDPRRYRSWVARNSDFRKYDDALRMTIDCTPVAADALESTLARAEADGIVAFGLHRQDAALMTCIVPSYVSDDHVHFLDGAGGGYALAAQALKDKLAQRKAAAMESAA